VLLMASHYALSIAMLINMWGDTLPGTQRMLELHPLWMVGTAIAYMIPHVYAWGAFMQCVGKPK
jgi:hypothetical protein